MAYRREKKIGREREYMGRAVEREEAETAKSTASNEITDNATHHKYLPIPPYTDLYVHLSFFLESWQCKYPRDLDWWKGCDGL
jgi:hypothetical protein